MSKRSNADDLINHIYFVLDGSGSMGMHQQSLIRVVDGLVKDLAVQSQAMDQETRVTIYKFSDASDINCLVYEKDVLRLPSIADLYDAHGQTALIDAIMLSQQDLALQPQKYGKHAFITYILTDGQENQSRKYGAADLMKLLSALPDNQTVAALVPSVLDKIRASQWGIPNGNIVTWDTTSATGVEEAVATVAAATSNYMTTRATTGASGTKNLFQMNTAAATSATVKQLKVKPLERGKYVLINPPAQDKTAIKDMVEDNGLKFRLGLNYYQLRKPEKIQADKKIALVRKQRKGVTDADVFVGYEIRDFLGLPDHEVRVGPQSSPDYDIFIQSNSNNRHMMTSQFLLVLEPAHK